MHAATFLRCSVQKESSSPLSCGSQKLRFVRMKTNLTYGRGLGVMNSTKGT